MNFNLGTTLKTVEKKFGPSLPGLGAPEKTVSAFRYPGGKGKKFGGVPGIHPGAKFYVHFPLVVDLTQIKSKKGVFDFINDLKEDGPQSKQGREAECEVFLREIRVKEEAERTKEEAKRAKAKQVERDREFARHFVNLKTVEVEIDGQRYIAKVSVTKGAKPKVKIAIELSL